MTETARVFTDVRDFPIYISHMDDQTRIWFAPYRVWDGAVAVLGLIGTATAMYHWLNSGHVLVVGVLGLALTGLATWVARFMPISRPSPAYRVWWLLTALFANQRRAAVDGRRDPWLSPPKAVIDNLIFTQGGVWAEFLLTGQPGGMLPYERKRAIAKGHRPLVRQLPSGIVLWGVCVRVSPRRIKQRMLAGYQDRGGWVGEVRAWDDVLAVEPYWEVVFGVRVPVDAGMAGRSSTGGLAKTWKTIVGADPDDPGTLASYREFAEEIRAKIPAQFEPAPATPRQIRWLYHRHITRGADDSSFPHGPGGPDRLTATEFADMPADFDEGDQQGRKTARSWLRRRLPSLTPILRVGTDTGHQSYQALLPVEQLPRQGLAHPGAEYLLSVYDVDTDADVDWFHHVNTRSREKALARVDRAQRNLDDQAFQRAGRRASNNDLAARYESGEEYNTELESSSLERETEWATVVAVGSGSAQATTFAARALRTHMGEELEMTLGQPRGAQRALWQLGTAGSEQRAPRSQYGQPTTTKHWARFAPLASAELGNDTGILLARNLSTLRPGPVFVDLEGSTERRDAPGMLWMGPPGGGKSQGVKRIVDGLIKRGSQVSIIDPGTMREWGPALAHHGDAVAVLDPTSGQWSLDPLRLFPRRVAVEHTLDHLLPLIGVEPDSVVAGQLRRLLRDERIGSLGALVRYLNTTTEYIELTAKLNAWAEIDYLRAVFDDTLPAPPIAQKDAVIWLTADLELPKTSETDNVHLYRRQSSRARAGLALYGLIASLTRLTYTGPTRRGSFGWLVCEEARTYLASPVGREDAQRIVTQGRKEHYGLIAISQHIEDFAGIPTQDLPMRVITPFKATEREYARATFHRMGIDPDEYPDVLETRTVKDRGYAYFIDHLGRAGLIDLLTPVQQQLRDAFDTRRLGNLARDEVVS
jgi:hypothetical protein